MSTHDPLEPATPEDRTRVTAPAEPVGSATALEEPRRSGLDSLGRVKRTRAATAWVTAVAMAVAAVVVVVLVIQNSDPIPLSFLWLDGELPAAAALLVAAIAGALLVAVPAAARIAQLRRSLRRNG